MSFLQVPFGEIGTAISEEISELQNLTCIPCRSLTQFKYHRRQYFDGSFTVEFEFFGKDLQSGNVISVGKLVNWNQQYIDFIESENELT